MLVCRTHVVLVSYFGVARLLVRHLVPKIVDAWRRWIIKIT
jgi:hypothetical protein